MDISGSKKYQFKLFAITEDLSSSRDSVESQSTRESTDITKNFA